MCVWKYYHTVLFMTILLGRMMIRQCKAVDGTWYPIFRHTQKGKCWKWQKDEKGARVHQNFCLNWLQPSIWIKVRKTMDINWTHSVPLWLNFDSIFTKRQGDPSKSPVPFPETDLTMGTSCAKLCILLKIPTISNDLEAFRLGHQGSSCARQWYASPPAPKNGNKRAPGTRECP